MGGAGKSTILALAAGEDASNMDPTKGFNIKAIATSKAILNVKELGGSDSVRPYWCKYISGVQAVIVVVDSASSREELGVAFEEIYPILQEDSLSGLPLMVLLHKQDLASEPEDEIQSHFDINRLCEGRVNSLVLGTSHDSPQELKQCFEEMSQHLHTLYAANKDHGSQYKQFQ